MLQGRAWIVVSIVEPFYPVSDLRSLALCSVAASMGGEVVDNLELPAVLREE